MNEQGYQDGGNLLAVSHRESSEEMRIAAYLKEIRDERMYTADGYETFTAFCKGEFDMPFSVADRLIRSYDASLVAKN